MTKSEFIEVLEQVWELDPGTIRGDEVIDDVGTWESIAVVEFIALIDENAGITLQPEKIAEAKTIQDLMNLLGDNIIP